MPVELPPALAALRTGVARSARPTALLRIVGEQAFDLLDASLPRPLFLRDGQALHTLFLDGEGHPLADVYVACDDLDYLVFAEGMDGPGATRWLLDHAPGGLDADVRDLGPTHTLVSFDGPYAWELVGRLVGPEVVGVPYLSLFFLPAWQGVGLRAGKTGEYGYDLLLPNSALPAFEGALEPHAREFQLTTVGLDDLDLCALENGFFSVRAPGNPRLGPAELQLAWRLDLRRDFPGRATLERTRATAPRVSWFRGLPGDPLPSGEVRLDGEPVGEVCEARWSHVLGAPVGRVLLPRPVAHPGLTLDASGLSLRTVSAPLLRNRSLFVSAQRHAWASRHVDVFPPIAP